MNKTAAASLRRPSWFLPTASTALAVLAWEALSQVGALPIEVAPPSAVGPWLISTSKDSGFWLNFATTMYQWIVGLVLATIAGIAIGLAMSTNQYVSKLLQVPVEFMRPIPPIIYLPLVLLLFGATNGVGFCLAAVGAMWPVLFQTVYGVRSLDQLTLDTAKIFGLTPRQRVLNVLIPGVAPSIATGIRVAAAIALVVVVTVELAGGVPGLGAELRSSQLNGIYPAIYGLTLILGGLGLLVNVGLESIEAKMLKWHESHRPRT